MSARGIVLVAFSLVCGWVVCSAPPPGYHLIWGDEFNGTSLNSSKWSWGSLPWGGNYHNSSYASYITSEDSYLNGSGSLILRCRKVGANINGNWVPWTEGFVHSNGKFRYTYGYAEIRARFPVTKGAWPAFWTLSDGWPPEFDIAEYFGDDNRMHMGYAYGTCCPVNWDSTNLYNEGFDQWHTYGLEWGNGWAKWYRDGVVRKTINASYITSQSMYLILNSGMTWGYDSSTANPNYTEIDYCRVYAAGASTAPTISTIANRTIPTNTSTPPLPFTIGDAETPVSELTVTASSGNTTVVPNANIVISGSGSNRTVVVTPAANQSGSALISIQVFDGEFTTTETFTLTVSGTNNSPVISSIPDLTVPSSQPWGGRTFTIGDVETAVDALVLSANSSNPDLFPATNIFFSGSGSNRLVFLRATPGNACSSNSSLITISVSDGALSASVSFRAAVSDSSNLVANPGFEQGLAGFERVFGGTLGVTTDPVHDGLIAGLLSERGDWYHGLGVNLTGRILSGQSYRAEAWVRLAGSTNDSVYLTVRVIDSSGTHYYRAVNARAGSGGWTRIAGDFTPELVGNVTSIVAYVEGPPAGVDLLVDDFNVTPRSQDLLIPLGSVWRYRDSGVAPEPDWVSVNYNDGNWSSGPAQLGYGDGDEATLVGYGPSATNKYITTWFRSTFVVTNSWVWPQLELRVLRDDGAIVYLNGVEVYRGNLPQSGVTANTRAISGISGADEVRLFSTNISPALLRIGTNVVAVEVHQNSPNSSDLSFDLELAGMGAQPVVIIPARSPWKYDDSGANLGTAWRVSSYDDSSWKSGFGQLGFGDGDEGTVIASNRQVTTYFRKSFVLNEPAAFAQFAVRIQRDDGAVVYLNGNEVFRSNITNGNVSATTLAYNATDDGNGWFSTNVPSRFFVAGTNIFAVEVHQSSLASSDLSFDLELLGYPAMVLPELKAGSVGGGIELSWPAWASGYSIYRLSRFTPGAVWLRVTNSPVSLNGVQKVTLPRSSATDFYRLGSP